MQWYAEQGRFDSCCRDVSPEEAAQDPEAYECEGCERRRREEELDAQCHLALRLHGLLARSATRDLGLTPLVFDALQIEATQDEALELFEMVAEIHDAARQIASDDQEAEEERRTRKKEAREMAQSRVELVRLK